MNRKSNYIFFFSPNNSGTTVISQYLASQVDGYLPDYGNNEGQYIPEVKKIMRKNPWGLDVKYNWVFIKSIWDEYLRRSKKDVFIEASPPNIMHFDSIMDTFEGADFIVSISSPYAQIASCIYNYESQAITKDILASRARDWLFKAELIRGIAEARAARGRLITYEKFCENPKVLNNILGLNVKSFDVQGKKNSSISSIVDLSKKNISFLTFTEIDVVNSILVERVDLLDYFGYELLRGKDLITADDLHLLHSGLVRRMQWENRIGRKNKTITGYIKRHYSELVGLIFSR